MRKFEFTESRWELDKHPLGEFFVRHIGLEPELVRDFETCLADAETEAPIQDFLEAHPGLLVQHLLGSARFVLPRKRLGAEFIPDFVVGGHLSDGYQWQLIELESPCLPFFTKKGDPTAALSHAIRQITDWRAWLQRNQNYAARARAESGLGLADIRSDVPGLILMGRRTLLAEATNERRRQMAADLNVAIHTYDYLLEGARAAVDRDRALNPPGPKGPGPPQGAP
jgi:hypothetical protein